MSLPTRCKKTAAPSTSGERGDSPSVTRLTKQSGLEEVTDTRIAISDCIDRDIACIQCIVNIAESPIAASSNVVDKSRNFVVVCDQKAAAYNPGCSRCVALKSFCRKVPEVAKAQADTLYANYRQFHNGSCDGSQKQILYSAVHDWLRVAYEHDISEGIQQGLNQVFPSPEQAYEAKDKVIDIIAIHGLNGTSLSAWVAWKKDGDPSSGDVHWLRDPDMLPSRIPTARIFTYDWNSKYDNSAAEEKLLGHADDLLRSLTMERAQDGINRPILFVASCFGGLLLAKALHRASEVKSRYQDILKLTVGVAFLGTPFQGGHPGAVTAAQMRIAVAMEMGFESSSKLVKYLEAEGNDELDELVQSFCEMVNKPGSKFPIVCFYERHTMDFTAMIRDLSPEAKEHLKQDSKGLLTSERSACLAGHDRIGLPVRHNMLIKYSGPHNRVFKTVSYQLECMVEQAAETLERKNWKYSKGPKKQEDGLDLLESESTLGCLKSLAFSDMNSRYNGVISAFKGTCSWLYDNQSFKNWASDHRGLLWIRGKPGTGKSTLLKYALEETAVAVRGSGRSDLVMSFFFDGRGHELQKTRKGFCRSLLHQLLLKSPDALSNLIDTYVQREKTMGKAGEKWEWDENELWGFFEGALPKILNSFPVVLFVDALDECNEDVSIKLVNDFTTLLEVYGKGLGSFGICFSCRHYPLLEPEYGPGKGLTISVEDENTADIETYVQTSLSNLPHDYRVYVSLIISRARGIFLWAHLAVQQVLHLLRRKKGRRQIEQEIEKTPQGLDGLYRQLIENLEERPETLRLIQWICFSQYPLSANEIRWAMAINPDPDHQHNTLRECRDAIDFIEDDDIDARIKVLSCGLVEVIQSERKIVQFIHQSVVDFFATSGLGILAGKSMSVKEISIEANYCITRSCVRYIAMEEFAEVESWTYSRKTLTDFPLLYYAAFEWVRHAQEAEGIASSWYLLDLFDWPSKQLIERWEIIHFNISTWNRRNRHEGNSLLLVSLKFGLIDTAWAIIHRIRDGGGSLNAGNSFGEAPLAIAVQNGYNDICIALINAGADINAEDGARNTPLSRAAELGNERTVRLLLDAGAMADYKDRYGSTALMVASSKEVAEALVGAKADVNMKNHVGLTPLREAVDSQHRDVVRFLITNGAEVNWKDKWGHSPLWIAACNGYEALVQDLLAAGAEKDTRDERNRTPLWIATSKGHEDVVKLLLAAGAEKDARDKQNRTPLWIATSKGYEDVVKLLLAANPEADLGNEYGRELLYTAVCEGHEVIVQHLLAAGADANSWEFYTQAPLYVAVLRRYEVIVKHLLSAGADVYSWDEPLNLAVVGGNEAIVQHLLSYGADANSRNEDGQPLLLVAMNEAYGQHPDGAREAIIQHLLAAGADVNSDIDGWTPLQHAILWMLGDGVIRSLLAAGAMVNYRGPCGTTPLCKAACNGDETIVQLLLAANAEVDIKDDDGNTPTCHAAVGGSEGIIRLLLNTGKVDINVKDNNGRTPLWMAAGNGRMAVVRLLLNTDGVDINSKDNDGRPPLWAAAEVGHEAVVRVFLETEAVNKSPRGDWMPLKPLTRRKREAIIQILHDFGIVNENLDPNQPGPGPWEDDGILVRWEYNNWEGAAAATW